MKIIFFLILIIGCSQFNEVKKNEGEKVTVKVLKVGDKNPCIVVLEKLVDLKDEFSGKFTIEKTSPDLLGEYSFLVAKENIDKKDEKIVILIEKDKKEVATGIGFYRKGMFFLTVRIFSKKEHEAIEVAAFSGLELNGLDSETQKEI